MNGKRIAVLLSAYNGEQYIEKQVESILKQEHLDSLTIIVRNDGSNDGTLDILCKLKESHSEIDIVEGQNIGLVASFLELLNYAYGKGYDYYSFCDQDDYWLPEKLNVAIKSLEGHEEPCMYASCSTIVNDNLEPTGGLTQIKVREINFYNSAIQNFCPGHNQVLNRAMARMVVSKTKYSPDIYSQDMWITEVASVTGTIIFDNTPHTLYRQHGNNQLSFGKSKLEWVKSHVKRLQKNEGKKIATQLKYFCDSYSEYLTKEQKDEVEGFFESQESLFKRIIFVANTKMYRQRGFETPLFKMIYLMGGYNI